MALVSIPDNRPCATQTDCTSALPAYQKAECAKQFETPLSQICTIYLMDQDADGNPAAKPTSFTDPTAWNIDPAAAGAIRCIYGIGDIAIPNRSTIGLPKGLTKTTKRDFTLNFDIFNMSDDNVNIFLRGLCCDWCGYMYFSTLGGKLYGLNDQNDPIPVQINVDQEFGRGDEDIELGKLVATWDALCTHYRIGLDPFTT